MTIVSTAQSLLKAKLSEYKADATLDPIELTRFLLAIVKAFDAMPGDAEGVSIAKIADPVLATKLKTFLAEIGLIDSYIVQLKWTATQLLVLQKCDKVCGIGIHRSPYLNK